MPTFYHLRAIRFWLAIVIAGLVLSGVTAFPLESELRWVHSVLQTDALRPIPQSTHLLPWIARVHGALSDTNGRYPFLAYGTDWLAFAHLVIAVAFLGPYRDPVRNKWLITFVAHHFRSDCLRGCDSAGSYRGNCPRHSDRMAVDRLQLRSLRRYSASALQTSHSCTGTDR